MVVALLSDILRRVILLGVVFNCHFEECFNMNVAQLCDILPSGILLRDILLSGTMEQRMLWS